ncbi:MAG: RDD family protein, partial [bacterium]|nr:RDD family protein [bacterium]
ASIPLPEGQHLSLIAGVVIASAYFIILEGNWGCTLGRWVTRTRVVDSKGRHPGIGKAVIRTALRFVEANPVVFGGAIAGVVAGYTPARQRIGDLIARTYVLQVSDLHLLLPDNYEAPSSPDWITRFEDWQRNRERSPE